MIFRYFRFVKLEHTLFSLPIVFSGVFLALELSPPEPSLSVSAYFWIFVAVFTARSAGFAMNRIIDHKIDKKNRRTQMREIPAGLISVRSAWIFVALHILIFFFAAYRIAPLCLWLSPVPMGLFLIYPFLKRWTAWTHLGLGLAWGVAPMGGWLAVSPELLPLSRLTPALLLVIFSIFWVAGFDVLYALLDMEFDQSEGLFSLPAAVGKIRAQRFAAGFHLIAYIFLALLAIGYLRNFASLSLLLLVGILFILSHWKVNANGVTPQVINFAFFKVNAAMGFVVLALIIVPLVLGRTG